MKRVRTTIGDIFSVQLGNNQKKYFQYIANDLNQLNSDVIRVFKKSYPRNEDSDLSTIVNDEVEFYAHCATTMGIKMGFWEKVGKSTEVGKTDILFRDTNDCGHKAGEQPIEVSHNWHVWRITDPGFTRAGKLKGKNQGAEIGVVFPPAQIVHRMKTGEYNFVYPKYK